MSLFSDRPKAMVAPVFLEKQEVGHKVTAYLDLEADDIVEAVEYIRHFILREAKSKTEVH